MAMPGTTWVVLLIIQTLQQLNPEPIASFSPRGPKSEQSFRQHRPTRSQIFGPPARMYEGVQSCNLKP